MVKKFIAVVVLCIFVGLLTGLAGAADSGQGYVLTISVSGSGKVVGKDISCEKECEIRLPAGTEVDLEAQPLDEWRFMGWSGACEDQGGCKLVMDGNKSVGAVFTYP